jgi:hypothetical protein
VDEQVLMELKTVSLSFSFLKYFLPPNILISQ